MAAGFASLGIGLATALQFVPAELPPATGWTLAYAYTVCVWMATLGVLFCGIQRLQRAGEDALAARLLPGKHEEAVESQVLVTCWILRSDQAYLFRMVVNEL